MRGTSLFLAAAMGAAQAAPLVTTVDGTGDVGYYTSLQLSAGRPIVAYYDVDHGDLKLATCVDACSTAAPAWIVTTVDRDGDQGWNLSLQLNDGRPVIAYRDASEFALKLATCVARCATPSPEWVITYVDHSSPDTGRFPSLQFNAGKPVIAYRDKSFGRLKLAACTAGCETRSPEWIITTVDSDGDVGRFTSMQLDNGRPVIAYYDFAGARVKVATCTDACYTAQPAWAINVIDSVPDGDLEMQFGLGLDGGKAFVSYYVLGAGIATGALRVAACVAACGTGSASWIVNTVDEVGDAGVYSSLRMSGGRPVVAYAGTIFTQNSRSGHIYTYQATDLRIATCNAGCATSTPSWTIATVDNNGLSGWDPSLQVEGGGAYVTYYDFMHGDLKMAWLDLAEAARPPNHTGLWWNVDESGWGVNFSHQGDLVFGTLFTYDAAGKPLWLAMPAGSRQASGAFAGTLYRTTGPAFDADPFTPITAANLAAVGSMSARFAGDTAFLEYTINGTTLYKTVRKQVFAAHAAACTPSAADRGSLTNYQDLWWNPSESGWGINLTHQADVIFATLFTYNGDASGVWFVMSAGVRQADGSYSGDLFRATGPAFDALPFPPIAASDLTRVGAMTLRFSSGAAGTLSYSIDGRSVVKRIERQVFGSPTPACSW